MFQSQERHSNPAAIAALGICASILGACSGTALTSPPVQTAGSLDDVRKINPNVEDFTYQTINDPNDPTTEILGINNLGKIVGYYGDGTASNPEIGFDAVSPYAAKNFHKQTYPQSINTEITAVNNTRAIAGWYQTSKKWIFGAILWEGIWQNYKDSHLRGSPTQLTEIYGLNDDGLAVGYYQDSSGVNHAFELDETTDKFHGLFPPNAKSSVATGISGKGDIVGWLTTSSGATLGFLLKGAHYTEFAYPGAVSTQPWSVNWQDDIVGQYQDASGNTHGFILINPLTSQSWQRIDEPNATGETVVTSVNDHHTMVGFYQDSQGNIDGFLATLKK